MVKIFAALLLALSLTFVGIGVSAQAESDDGTRTEQSRPLNREVFREKAEQRQAEAEVKVTEAREAAEERRLEVKAEVCERRQERLTQMLPRLSTGATTVLERIDTVFDRVQGFYEDGQLTVADYDTKVEAIVSAQATASTLVSALSESVPTIDCENMQLGVQLDTYRSATKDAREALKAYRAALVDLISALKAAAADQTSDNTTADDTTTETPVEGDPQDAQQ